MRRTSGKLGIVSGGLVGLLIAVAALAAQPDKDGESTSRKQFDTLRRYFGLLPYLPTDGPSRTRLNGMKIAILGYRFKGLSQEDGRADAEGTYVPTNAEIMTRYPDPQQADEFLETTPPDFDEDKDRRLATIIWELTGRHTDGPLFKLFNANPGDLRNFRGAITSAVTWGADIIFNTVSFPAFGNMDGTGPLNFQIQDGIRSPRIWIQSAGDYRKSVHNSPVHTTGLEQWYQDPRSRDRIEARCGGAGKHFVKFRQTGVAGDQWFLRFKINADNVKVTATANWNSYLPRRAYAGTNNDLDLYLMASAPGAPTIPDRIVARSEVRQTAGAIAAGEGRRRLAYEEAEATFDRSDNYYFVVLRRHAGTFDPGVDRVRITLRSDHGSFFNVTLQRNVEALEFTDLNEGSIMIPSDSRYVFTVGDVGPYSSVGPVPATVEHPENRKPDLRVDSPAAFFPDTIQLSGPDVAAAYVTAFTVLMKSKEANFDMRALRLVAARQPADTAYAVMDSGTVRTRLTGENWILDPSRVGEFWRTGQQPHAAIGDLFTQVERSLLGVKSLGEGQVAVGLDKHPLELPIFENATQTQKDNPGDYAFFLQPIFSNSTYTFQPFVSQRNGGRTPWASRGVARNNFVQLIHLGLPFERASPYSRSPRWTMPTLTVLGDIVAGR